MGRLRALRRRSARPAMSLSFFENRVTLEFECERVFASNLSVPPTCRLRARIGKGWEVSEDSTKNKAKSTQLKGLILAQNER